MLRYCNFQKQVLFIVLFCYATAFCFHKEDMCIVYSCIGILCNTILCTTYRLAYVSIVFKLVRIKYTVIIRSYLMLLAYPNMFEIFWWHIRLNIISLHLSNYLKVKFLKKTFPCIFLSKINIICNKTWNIIN